MRSIRVAAVAMAVVVAVVAGAGAAGACSQTVPPPTEQELFDRADLVFEGTALSISSSTTSTTVLSSFDPIIWIFSVDRVDKGAAVDPQPLTTTRYGASCGFNFEVGRRYLVYATLEGGAYSTALFSGTRDVTDDPPVTVVVEPDPPVPTPNPDPPGTREPLARTGLATPGILAGALVLVAAGVFLTRRAGRAR